MNLMRFLVTLLTISGAECAASQDVRAKELYYGGGPETTEQKSKPRTAQRAGGRVPAAAVGLKCSVQLLNKEGEWVWVSPDRPFYSGDRVRIHVESNTGGRLSILQKQDDGTPELLFPNPQLRNNDDTVEKGRDVVIPLRFNDDPGKIVLFVLLRTAKKAAASARSSEESSTLLTQAETATRSKGLKIDVDNSSSEPAMFAVQSPSGTRQEEVMAAQMTLDHRQPEKR